MCANAAHTFRVFFEPRGIRRGAAKRLQSKSFVALPPPSLSAWEHEKAMTKGTRGSARVKFSGWVAYAVWRWVCVELVAFEMSPNIPDLELLLFSIPSVYLAEYPAEPH